MSEFCGGGRGVDVGFPVRKILMVPCIPGRVRRNFLSRDFRVRMVQGYSS